jgi:hypothetical protein
MFGIGDLLRVKTLHHYQNSKEHFELRPPNKKAVMVLAMLGYEDVDRPGSLDVEARLAQMGYFPATDCSKEPKE